MLQHMKSLRGFECVCEKQFSNDNAPPGLLFEGRGSAEAQRASLKFLDTLFTHP